MTTPAQRLCWAWVALGLLLSGACESDKSKPKSSAQRGVVELPPHPQAEQGVRRSGVGEPSEADAGAALPPEPAATPHVCPAAMVLIRGGEFFVGSPMGVGSKDEHPRFETRLHDYCMDRHEVTVAEYQWCVEHGPCSSAERPRKTCNAGRPERAQHPINCVTWQQAHDYCATVSKRLPTEIEWEYAARGGSELRRYSWGNEPPDGRACWKRSHTCEVGSYRAGAFELFDMMGNVWEWTESYYGSYPWPRRSGTARVYRGGSWSRRFEKWLSPTLRNRYGEQRWGSHLGFRCVSDSALDQCPYGASGDRCLHGVESAECEPPRVFNGVRCARVGEAGCPGGQRDVPGYGCVPDGPTLVQQPHQPPAESTEVVQLQRSPAHDADCRLHQPQRPLAWRLSGATHPARNRAGSGRGCKNRDVGVGWNSVCCPK